MSRAETGRAAEDAAAALLSAKGMTILERNFRAKVGELDLVARHGDEIVFVEVRARASSAFGGAAASVGGAKRRKLILAAKVWLQARRWDGPCRFDVVAIDAGRAEHIPAAFDGSGR
ncbi:MAG: YraN family protein [Elusimicrobiota bacterium]|nr:MAG: YraN family protein [Elusimicrobiota bacterium]